MPKKGRYFGFPPKTFRDALPDVLFLSSQRNSRRLWPSRRRKIRSVAKGGADFPAAIFLAGEFCSSQTRSFEAWSDARKWAQKSANASLSKSAKERKRAQKGVKGRKRAKIANIQVWSDQVWELPRKCPNCGRDSTSRCRKIGEEFSSSVDICQQGISDIHSLLGFSYFLRQAARKIHQKSGKAVTLHRRCSWSL